MTLLRVVDPIPPTEWPADSALAGSPMLSSERRAWMLGYTAGMKKAWADAVDLADDHGVRIEPGEPEP